jgi:hypothetical protein
VYHAGGPVAPLARLADAFAENRSLACLETLVHLGAGGLPLNHYLVEISIPDPVWTAARREFVTSLPVGWDVQHAFGGIAAPLDDRRGGALPAGQPGPSG